MNLLRAKTISAFAATPGIEQAARRVRRHGLGWTRDALICVGRRPSLRSIEVTLANYLA